MKGLTILAWVADTGLLINAIVVLRMRLATLSDRGWDGIPLVILLGVVLLGSIIGSVVLTWIGETRGMRIASLVVAGAIPAACLVALVGLALTGMVLLVAGGPGKFR